MSWITNLRARLNWGELVALSPVDVGYGSVPAEWTVRIMLGELDDFEDLAPDEANTPVNVARRASLLADFRILRTRIS